MALMEGRVVEMALIKGRCKATVMRRMGGWRKIECLRNATKDGFCAIHHPGYADCFGDGCAEHRLKDDRPVSLRLLQRLLQRL